METDGTILADRPASPSKDANSHKATCFEAAHTKAHVPQGRRKASSSPLPLCATKTRMKVKRKKGEGRNPLFAITLRGRKRKDRAVKLPKVRKIGKRTTPRARPRGCQRPADESKCFFHIPRHSSIELAKHARRVNVD